MDIKTFPELALELLESDSNIVLSADGGYGKTAALAELCRKILNEKTEINGKKLIPVFVPAAMCESGIRSYIAMHYYGNNIFATERDMQVLIQKYDETVLNAENSKYRFVIIVDGINENGKINEYFTEVTVLSLCKNVNVILSSKNYTDLDCFISKGFVQVSLSQVSHEQAKAVFSSPSSFSSIEELPGWAYTPFYLTILKKTETGFTGGLSAYRLIDEYVECSKDKLSGGWNHTSVIEASFVEDLSTVLNNVFPIVCTFLMQANNRVFSLTESLLIAINEKLGYGYNLSSNQLVAICDSILIPMGLLIPVHSHTKKYSIKHEIYRDYFVARYLKLLCEEEKEYSESECFEIMIKILSNHISKDALNFFIQSINEPYAQIQRINDYISDFDNYKSCARLNQNIVTLFSLLGNEIKDADFSNRNLVSSDFCTFDRILNSCFNGSVFGNESLPFKNIRDVSSSVCSYYGRPDVLNINILGDICTLVLSDKCFIIDMNTGLLRRKLDILDIDLFTAVREYGALVFNYRDNSYLVTADPSEGLLIINNLSTSETKKVQVPISPDKMHFINKTIYAYARYSNGQGKMCVYSMENDTFAIIENISAFGGDDNRCIWFIDDKNDNYTIVFADKSCYRFPLRGAGRPIVFAAIACSVINNFLFDDKVVFITDRIICWGCGGNDYFSFSDDKEILDATYFSRDRGLIALLVGENDQEYIELLIFDVALNSISQTIRLSNKKHKKTSYCKYQEHLLAINGNCIAVLCENGLQMLRVHERSIEKGRFISSVIHEFDTVFPYQGDFIFFNGKKIKRICASGEIVWEICYCTESCYYEGKSFLEDMYFIVQKGDFTKVITLDSFQRVTINDIFPSIYAENTAGFFHFTEDPNIIYSFVDERLQWRDDKSDGILGTIVYIRENNTYKRLFRLSSFYYGYLLPEKLISSPMNDLLIPNFQCLDFHVIDKNRYVAYGTTGKHADNSVFDEEYCIYCISNDQHIRKLFSSHRKYAKAVYFAEFSKYFICGDNGVDIISLSGEQSPVEVEVDFGRIYEIHGISRNGECCLLFENSNGWYLAEYDAINQKFISKCILKGGDWCFVEYSSDDKIVFRSIFNIEHSFGVSLKDECIGIPTPCLISEISANNGMLQYKCSNRQQIAFTSIDDRNLCVFDKNNIENRYGLFPFFTDVTGSSFRNTNLSEKESDILKQYGAKF